MARDRIKGITIEIGGDASGLKKALDGLDKDIRNIQYDLKDVDRLLKLDPKNTELLTQKQKLLTEEIDKTRQRLETLKDAEAKAQEQFKQGKISKEQYDALKREVIATEQAEKNLSGQLKETSKRLDENSDSLQQNIVKAGLTKDAIVAVAKAVVGLAKDAVEYNAELESYTAAFASFLGSMEAAEGAIARIKEDAARTPFGTSELIQANQLLITAGVSADEARTNINALAAAVAATGGGNAELSRMSSNLQQIKNTGKATSMDIKQFANAGINIYGLLADYAEATNQDLETMEMSYENITAAIKMSTEEGGRYYGAMEAQVNTYNGQLNQLKAKIKDTLGTTFESVSETLKNEVFPAINKALESIDFEALGKSIGNIISLISAILPAVNFIVTNVIGAIADVINNLSPMFTRVKEILQSIIDFVVNVFTFHWRKAFWNLADIVKSIFAGIGDVFMGIINSIVSVLNRVISWFTGNANTIQWAQNASRSNSGSGRGELNKNSRGANTLMASGGVISNGTVLVGDNGPELLTMNGGVATVSPINNSSTTNLGGINMNIYGAQGQNVNDLADVIMNRIQNAVVQKGAVWA